MALILILTGLALLIIALVLFVQGRKDAPQGTPLPNGRGIPYTGLSNARPETKAIGERVKRYIESMPFDVKEFLEHEIPGSDSVGDWGK